MAVCITPPQNCCATGEGSVKNGWTDSEMSQLLPDCVERLALIMAGYAGFAQLKHRTGSNWVSIR
jgi:hypothetical protein